MQTFYNSLNVVAQSAVGNTAIHGALDILSHHFNLHPLLKKSLYIGFNVYELKHLLHTLTHHKEKNKHPKVHAHPKASFQHNRNVYLGNLGLLAGGVFGLHFSHTPLQFGVSLAGIGTLSYLNGRNKGLRSSYGMASLAIGSAAALTIKNTGISDKGLQSFTAFMASKTGKGKWGNVLDGINKALPKVDPKLFKIGMTGLVFSGALALAHAASKKVQDNNQTNVPTTSQPSNYGREDPGPKYKYSGQPTSVSMTSRIS